MAIKDSPSVAAYKAKIATQKVDTPIIDSPILDTNALKAKIDSWNFTSQDTLAYNRATNNNQWARQEMLWSQQAMNNQNVKTSLTANDIQTMKSEWNTNIVNPNITADPNLSHWIAQNKIDLQNAQNQQVNQPIQNIEKTTVQWPDWKITTTKETPKSTWITKDTNWADVPTKDMNSLEQLVESRYGTIATQKDWKLQATIWDKTYEWSLDNQWNPVKTEIQPTPAEQIKMKAINKYMTASTNDLYNAFVWWKITKEMEQGLLWNPNLALAKEKYDKKLTTDNINSSIKGLYNATTWKTTEEDKTIENMSNTIISNLNAKWIDIPKFSEFIAKDETLSSDVTSLNAQLKQIKELKDVAEWNMKQIEKDYPWISKNSAILLASRQNEPLYEQIKALSYDANELQANINYRQWILEEDYNQAVKQADLQNQRAYNEQQTAETRAYNEQLQTKQLEQQYAYQYWDLNSDNPTLQNIAIENAVAGMYKNYPIPWMESQATKVQKVKDK